MREAVGWFVSLWSLEIIWEPMKHMHWKLAGMYSRRCSKLEMHMGESLREYTASEDHDIVMVSVSYKVVAVITSTMRCKCRLTLCRPIRGESLNV